MPPFKSRLYGQDSIFNMIRHSYKDLPHLFITGPPGCGKTVCIEDILSMLREEAPFQIESVLYLTSEKDRGIHTIRDKVNDFCKTTHAKPNSLRFIVIDDADALPLISQQALRRPMETFSHLTRFIFASRHISNMIEPLRSRCYILEIEPISPLLIFPNLLELYDIPHETKLFEFCMRNLTRIHEIKSVLKMYKAFLKDGISSDDAVQRLNILIPTSSMYTPKLVHSIGNKDYSEIRSIITQLYLNGYVLDDILLAIEKYISIFPSNTPEYRYNVLQFTMLGWISIQQGKEHWLDTMDIIEQIVR
jgi:DNA polymerase III delta prime subunit